MWHLRHNLVLDINIDIMKMYLCTKSKFVGKGNQNLEPKQDAPTHLFAPVTLPVHCI